MKSHTLAVAKIALAGAVAGAVAAAAPAAHATPHNGTGAAPGNYITEDSPDWDCRVMGDRVCGPTNAQGVPAGCYTDQAVQLAPWPCYMLVHPDGSLHVYWGLGR